MDLEHTWFAARAVAAGRRRDSYAAAYVDVLAATPLISATSLAAGLGVTVKSAIRLLDGPGRRRRRRRGHATVEAAAVRAQGDGPAWRGRPTALPARPEPRRGRGRPPILALGDDVAAPSPPLPPLTPVERRRFGYSDLEHCMAQMDQAIRQTRRVLNGLAGPVIQDRTADQPTDGDLAYSARAGMEATP